MVWNTEFYRENGGEITQEIHLQILPIVPNIGGRLKALESQVRELQRKDCE